MAFGNHSICNANMQSSLGIFQDHLAYSECMGFGNRATRDVAYQPLTQFLISNSFMRVEPGHGVSLVFVVVLKAWARGCGKGENDVVRDA